jgi:hypothetical protein
MSLENPKKKLKERTKEKIWTTYFGCRAISTKPSKTCHGVFFQTMSRVRHCLFWDFWCDQNDKAPQRWEH